MDENREREALAWQTGVGNRLSGIYLNEIEHRFAPVVDALVSRAALEGGQWVLDVGTGTGACAERSVRLVGPDGDVIGVDISAEMLAVAKLRARDLGLTNIRNEEDRAESLPFPAASFGAVLASLSLMFVINREWAACEIAQVLRRRSIRRRGLERAGTLRPRAVLGDRGRLRSPPVSGV